ncbi:hypothetical protein dsat_0043 [Alkalidesulfovibrio alkalitolerans DSM 16529]|uniref:HPr kinase n=1 Tax=Alkalidesulfovibrio alkalitolerans DSM 16529 TaxID=1121439 RepID=S7TCX3_9BACT|nr:HprK-related kinase B [Alkalidesulfovibrio alkalitolerans]EPR34395.1 hypothetical protein dsat_0043 [Alkalidesulfovibrio alkalitolerans DSM 16529]
MSARVAALAEKFLREAPLTQQLGLRFGDTRIDVRSNSAALVAKLRDYYRDFLGEGGIADIEVAAIEREAVDIGLPLAPKTPEPGKRKIKEEFLDLPDGRVVRKRLTGLVCLFGGGLNLIVGPCIANDNQIVNFINNRYIERLIKRGCLLFHASGVAVGEQGLTLAGFAGMGKSTLALHIMRHGTDFVSNDRMMVERDTEGLVMHGLPKMPRVNPGTVLHNDSLGPVIPADERERFLAMPAEELWDLEHKYDAFIDECFGPDRFRIRCRMKALVLLNWRREKAPLSIARVDLTARRDLMPAFMKELGLFFEMDAETRGRDMSEGAYLAMLGDCPVYELSGGVDFEAAAVFCKNLLAP